MRRDRGDDRFDRMLERQAERRAEAEPTQHITSRRGDRFVGFTSCPHCFFPRVGVTFHGELMSGQKVYELARHTPGAGARRSGKPLCPASHCRLEKLPDGTWRKL